MLAKFFDSLSSFFASPKKVMWLSFILGVIFSVISIACITAYSNDAGLYIATAHSFSIGDWNRAFVDDISPLIPIMSGLITKLGVAPWDAATIVGCISYILTIFPLYGLLCFFIDKKYAAWGALFYLLAPKAMRYGMAPLLEGGKLLFFILPVYFTFSFAKNRKFIKLVYLGISLALLSLVRPEGITAIPFILVGLILLIIKNDNCRISFASITKILISFTIPIIVMLVVLSPRMYQLYIDTGYPTLDPRQSLYISDSYGRIFLKNDLKSKNIEIRPKNTAINEPSVAVFVAENKKLSFAEQHPKLDHFFRYWKDFSRGSYELYLILSVIGAIFLLYRKDWKLKHSLMIMFVLGNSFVFYLIATAYRYYLVNILLFMPFTLIGYKQILDWAVKLKVYKVLMLVVFVLAIFQIVNGMDNSIDKSKYYTMQAGTYLREHKSEFKKDSNGYPTIFVLGTDCGTNLFDNFNIINPGRTGLSFTLQEAMKGIPSDKCLSLPTKTSNGEILKPGAVLVFNPEEEPKDVAYLRNQPNIEEIKLHDIRETLLFKAN